MQCMHARTLNKSDIEWLVSVLRMRVMEAGKKRERKRKKKRAKRQRESKRQEDGDEKCRLAINSSATRKQYQSCIVITICRDEYFNYF